MLRDTKKIVDSVLVNYRTIYSEVVLMIRIISDDNLKEHTEIMNEKQEDNYFIMNSMEQIGQKF